MATPSFSDLQNSYNNMMEQLANLKQQMDAHTAASASSTSPPVLPTSTQVKASKKDNTQIQANKVKKEHRSNGDADEDDSDEDADEDNSNGGTDSSKTTARPNFNLKWKRPPAKTRAINLALILGITDTEKGVFWRACKNVISKRLDMTKCSTEQIPGTVTRTVQALNAEWPELKDTSDPDWLYRQRNNRAS
ncbi:hypothetical protein RSAG8_12058, partial [Rhizoctonia solani AG-8 WAC10335]